MQDNGTHPSNHAKKCQFNKQEHKTLQFTETTLETWQSPQITGRNTDWFTKHWQPQTWPIYCTFHWLNLSRCQGQTCHCHNIIEGFIFKSIYIRDRIPTWICYTATREHTEFLLTKPAFTQTPAGLTSSSLIKTSWTLFQTRLDFQKKTLSESWQKVSRYQ